MKKIFKATTFFAVSALVLGSCSKSDIEGYEKTDNGLYYKFYKQVENAPKPKISDEVHFKFVLKIKSTDSVLADSRQERPRDGIRVMDLRPSTFKGSLEEAFLMMGRGDSASFIVNADSFFLKTQQMRQLPPFMKPGDKIVADIKLVDFFDTVKVAEMNKKKQEEWMKQMQQAEMQAKADLEKYIADNKITVKPTESGLYFIELKKGNGPRVQITDTVMVCYKGTFLDGTVFDENTNDPEPLTFPLNNLIKGWQEGLTKMNVGGKAKLICPPQIGYGAGGGRMPPFANLVFEVEVKGVKSASGTTKK